MHDLQHHSRRGIQTIGSLSKDDAYGNKNCSPKYNLALSQIFRDYSVLLTLYNTGELSCNWMGTNGFKVKTENDCFIVIYSRCRKNLKFGDFTLLFCGVRQRNGRKFVLHVQHDYFSFLLALLIVIHSIVHSLPLFGVNFIPCLLMNYSFMFC